MPFKRKIEIGIVKDTKPNTNGTTPEAAPVDVALIVRETTETVAKYVAIGVAGYVALDTIRQILVKLTPEH